MTQHSNQPAEAIDPKADRHDTDHAEVLTNGLPVVGSRRVVTILVVVVAMLAVLFLVGFVPEQRRKASALAQAQRAKTSTPVVSVIKAARQSSSSDLLLPANAVALQT